MSQYTDEQSFTKLENDTRRQFDEFLHLDLQFHNRSNVYDKQLFYYDVSVILLILYTIKELLEYQCHWSIFIPLFFIILLCGSSSIALIKTLNLTMNAFELQKKLIRFTQDKEEMEKELNDLKIKNKNYNKYAFWSFVCACIILFLHSILLTILINLKIICRTIQV